MRNTVIRARVREQEMRPDTSPAIMTAITGTWPCTRLAFEDVPASSSRIDAGDLTVVEREHLVADELIRLVALAGDDHHVAGLGERDPEADRRGAVGFDLDAATVAVADPGQDLVDDGHRVLGARVVGRHDRQVGHARRRRSHQRPLRAVAVATGAEHDDDPAALADDRARRSR